MFLDELPWMDTPKSHFISALEHFWNGWAARRGDIVLVVCGSATSWIVDKMINDYGGLHDRLTRRIRLEPFTLRECEAMAQAKGLVLSRYQILELYMALGGIPFYWDLLERGESSAQAIDRLFFARTSIHATLVTTFGIRPGVHSEVVQSEVTLEDLFAF